MSAAVALVMLPRVALTQDSLPPDIATFTREYGDAGVRAHVVAHIDNPSVTLFSAGSNVGVQAGGRIGWLRQPADLWGTNRIADTLIGPVWFDLRPGDSAIAATAVDPRLAGVAEVQLRVWRTIVAQSAVTTLPTLLALVEADQTLGPAVATSPRLLETTSPLPTLIALANANDQVGAIVIQNPALASDPRALAILAERHPALWRDAMHIVLAHLSEVAASGPIDERMAVHLAIASRTLGVDSAVAVSRLAGVRRSAMAWTIVTLGARADSTQSGSRASETGVRELIGRIYADTAPAAWLPPPMQVLIVIGARGFTRDRTLLWALTKVNGHAAHNRWLDVRAEALMGVASDSHATPEELEQVARALGDSSYWEHRPFTVPTGSTRPLPVPFTRNREVAGKLLMNPRVLGNRTTMELLAALPPREFGSVPAMAARFLKTPPRRQ